MLIHGQKAQKGSVLQSISRVIIPMPISSSSAPSFILLPQRTCIFITSCWSLLWFRALSLNRITQHFPTSLSSSLLPFFLYIKLQLQPLEIATKPSQNSKDPIRIRPLLDPAPSLLSLRPSNRNHSLIPHIIPHLAIMQFSLTTAVLVVLAASAAALPLGGCGRWCELKVVQPAKPVHHREAEPAACGVFCQAKAVVVRGSW
jgi:hypothetical protein